MKPKDFPSITLEHFIDGTARVVEDFDWDGAHIPAGFITDGQSVPKIFHAYARPFGPGLWPALPHDYDYYTQEREQVEADGLFRQRELLIETRPSKAWWLWKVLRLFGRKAWNQRTKEKEAREMAARERAAKEQA